MDSDPFALNRESYDRIAPIFAQANWDMPPNLVEAADRLLIGLGGSPGRILDLGCGAGCALAWFTAQGQSCVGADLSWGMLEQSARRVGAPLCQMDMRRLGFATGSFAAVWCAAALLHLPKALAPEALSEIKRVLRPGGRLVLSMQVGSEEGIEITTYTGGDYRFFSRYQVEEMIRLLQDCDFRVLEVEENIAPPRHWMLLETCIG